MSLGGRLITIAALATASCSKSPSDYNSAANQIGEVGHAPREVKLVAAKMLLNCGLSVKGRHIFFQWEAPAGRAPYTLELPHEMFEDASTRACLDRQRQTLDAQQLIDFGEEAPPPSS